MASPMAGPVWVAEILLDRGDHEQAREVLAPADWASVCPMDDKREMAAKPAMTIILIITSTPDCSKLALRL